MSQSREFPFINETEERIRRVENESVLLETTVEEDLPEIEVVNEVRSQKSEVRSESVILRSPFPAESVRKQNARQTQDTFCNGDLSNSRGFKNLEFRIQNLELPLLEKKRIYELENFYLLSPIQGEALNHNISVNTKLNKQLLYVAKENISSIPRRKNSQLAYLKPLINRTQKIHSLKFKMKNTIISRLGFVGSLAIFGVVGFGSVARAGEGGIAGSAAFTVDAGNVTGVAVSAAVGKENASAAAFNYEVGSGLQNSAWALGTAGTQDFTGVGDPLGFNVTPTEDSDRATAQVNTFSAGTVTVQLGTGDGSAVVEAPQ